MTQRDGILLEHLRDLFADIFRISLVIAVLAGGSSAQTAGPDETRTPVATLDGQPLYEDQLPPAVRSKLQEVRQQELTLESLGIDALLEQKLLEADATKKGLTVAQLAGTEIDSKVSDPSADEVNAYYLARKEQYGQPFDQVKDQVQSDLKNLKIEQARVSYARNLLEKAKSSGEAVVLLSPKRIHVAIDSKRLKGNANAPVMIVEFADFSCPYCREAETSLKDLVTEYQGKVSVAYRDYPLRDIHPHAQIAAEASRCAEEQGKFWEYHDTLFANPDKQEREDLLVDARALKLDEKEFTSCLDSEKYKSEIDEDFEAGKRAGVTGTPGFLVNGILIDGLQSKAGFEQLINEELSAGDKKIAQQ